MHQKRAEKEQQAEYKHILESLYLSRILVEVPVQDCMLPPYGQCVTDHTCHIHQPGWVTNHRQNAENFIQRKVSW